MEAYIYKADIYCDDCADKIPQSSPKNRCEDSECCVQGPYPDGGGEADYAQHCGDCGVFLENPLTDDGVRHVMAWLEAPYSELMTDGNRTAQSQWAEFYADRIEAYEQERA